MRYLLHPIDGQLALCIPRSCATELKIVAIFVRPICRRDPDFRKWCTLISSQTASKADVNIRSRLCGPIIVAEDLESLKIFENVAMFSNDYLKQYSQWRHQLFLSYACRCSAHQQHWLAPCLRLQRKVRLLSILHYCAYQVISLSTATDCACHTSDTMMCILLTCC